jgi:hypothetical protein
MWIVTMAVNDHNQYGDYFVSAFTEKPTFKVLKKALPRVSDVTVGKLTRGGGRESFEGEWYFLTEVKDGEIYESS